MVVAVKLLKCTSYSSSVIIASGALPTRSRLEWGWPWFACILGKQRWITDVQYFSGELNTACGCLEFSQIWDTVNLNLNLYCLTPDCVYVIKEKKSVVAQRVMSHKVMVYDYLYKQGFPIHYINSHKKLLMWLKFNYKIEALMDGLWSNLLGPLFVSYRPAYQANICRWGPCGW